MKRITALALALIMVVCFSGIALAQAQPAATKAAPAPAKAAKPAAAKMHVFTGMVSAVDVVANTITVKKSKSEETFGVEPATKIKLRKEYKLAEVTVDSKVEVKYTEDAGKKTAKSIQILKLGKPVKTVK